MRANVRTCERRCGRKLAVPSDSTINGPSCYKGIENTVLTFGINHLPAVARPLSLRGGQGHLSGYDHRDTDAFGRPFYLSVDDSC